MSGFDLFDGEGIEFGHLQRELARRQSAEQHAESKRLIESKGRQGKARKGDPRGLCPNCHHDLDPYSKICSGCGKGIEWEKGSVRGYTETPLNRQCPACGGLLAGEFKKCVNCGGEI
jgi:predicted amidophosphoribosyltransferase